MRFLIYGLSNGWGGVETIVMSLVDRLKDHHKFDILIAYGDCSYEEKYYHPNIRFIRTISWGKNPWRFSNSLKKLYQAVSYDYVWINGCIMANKKILSVTKKNSKAKIITHSHGSSFEERNFVKRYLLLALHYLNRKYYLGNLDIPVTCSAMAARWFYGKSFCEKTSVYKINSGIDIKKFKFNASTRLRIRRELNTGNSVCLFNSGRLTFVKNQKKLISVLVCLLKKGIDVKLYIAGEGELKSELQNLIESLNLENRISLLGNRDDVNYLCQAMDVFLLPSFHEGFSISLVEAQASGLQCIASTGVPKEANLTGLVRYLDVNENDEIWAQAIIDMFPSPDRLKAFEIIEKSGFDINSVAIEFEKHIGAS